MVKTTHAWFLPIFNAKIFDFSTEKDANQIDYENVSKDSQNNP